MFIQKHEMALCDICSTNGDDHEHRYLLGCVTVLPERHLHTFWRDAT
jgi:hypothetical protein